MALPPMVRRIRSKWADYTRDTRGYFIRHIDGDTQNNNVSNVAYIHPKDAFRNPEYAVDWCVPLTKKETDFVLAHLNNFVEIYQ